MKVSSRNAVRVFKALSDVTRVEIVRLVGKAPRNVTELTSLVGVSQPKVSRHLKILRDAGLLKDVRRGKWVWYELAAPEESDPAGAVLSIIDSFLSGQGSPGPTPGIRPVATGLRPVTGVSARRSEPFRKPERAPERGSAQPGRARRAGIEAVLAQPAAERSERAQRAGADSGEAQRRSTQPRRKPRVRAPQRRAQPKDLEDFLL